jgi:hypothetical protein
MKIYFKFMLVLIASAGLVLTSCRKAASSADTASAQDNNNVSQHMNAAVDDAANAAGNSGVAGKTSSTDAWVLQGATIDSTQIATGTIVIIYDGTTIVDGRFKRSGSVTLTLNNYPTTHWRDSGAVLDLAFSNVKYTNVLNGNSYTYNGTTEIINNSGGLAWKILAGSAQGTVVHTHKSTGTGVSITFPDGSVRAWNFNRVRTYTNNAGAISVSLAAGGGTEGGYSNVDAWGTNRKGNQFYNQIITPIVFNNSCNTNYRDPVSGEDKHHVGGFSLDVLFGVDASGAVTTSCPDYGYKVTYTNSRNQSLSEVFQYWH